MLNKIKKFIETEKAIFNYAAPTRKHKIKVVAGIIMLIGSVIVIINDIGLHNKG